MNISSITATSFAVSVWAAAARTLTADPATDAGAATLVWGHAARTLTADPTARTAFSGNTTITAPGTLDLRPAANKFREISMGSTSANTNQKPGVYDGVTLYGLALGAAVASLFSGFGNSTSGVSMGATGGNVVLGYCGFDLG